MSLVPAGDALSLAALNKVLAPDAGGMDARRLTVAHGARLKIKAVNAVASQKVISILWKVDNRHIPKQHIKGDPGDKEGAGKTRESVSRGENPLFKGRDPNL